MKKRRKTGPAKKKKGKHTLKATNGKRKGRRYETPCYERERKRRFRGEGKCKKHIEGGEKSKYQDITLFDIGHLMTENWRRPG